MPADLDLTQLRADLTLDEGSRLKPYTDTVGKITIGIGRNLTDDGISLAEAQAMLANDINRVTAELDANASWWRLMSEPAQRVLANLCFNMGWGSLAQFTTFLGYMRQHDYAAAARDLQGTAWYGQVGERGPRTIARLAAGD
jgi:lysozyme